MGNEVPGCFFMKHGVYATTRSAHYNALLECSPSLKQMLLQLWQNEVNLNTYCDVHK